MMIQPSYGGYRRQLVRGDCRGVSPIVLWLHLLRWPVTFTEADNVWVNFKFVVSTFPLLSPTSAATYHPRQSIVMTPMVSVIRRQCLKRSCRLLRQYHRSPYLLDCKMSRRSHLTNVLILEPTFRSSLERLLCKVAGSYDYTLTVVEYLKWGSIVQGTVHLRMYLVCVECGLGFNLHLQWWWISSLLRLPTWINAIDELEACIPVYQRMTLGWELSSWALITTPSL